jgi:riboflavin biosynthesis pyrimidine reductase
VVTGTGNVDLSSAVFGSAAPALVVTTEAGAARLAPLRPRVPVAVAKPLGGWMPLRAVLATAGLGAGARVLVESGPTSTTRFLEEGAVDELFLTSAPALVGRGGATPVLALVEGRFFAPGSRPMRLRSVRRGGSFLFLRYGVGGA